MADYATSGVWGGLPNWPGRFPSYGLPWCLHKEGPEVEITKHDDLPARLFVCMLSGCAALKVRLWIPADDARG